MDFEIMKRISKNIFGNTFLCRLTYIRISMKNHDFERNVMFFISLLVLYIYTTSQNTYSFFLFCYTHCFSKHKHIIYQFGSTVHTVTCWYRAGSAIYTIYIWFSWILHILDILLATPGVFAIATWYYNMSGPKHIPSHYQ